MAKATGLLDIIVKKKYVGTAANPHIKPSLPKDRVLPDLELTPAVTGCMY